MLFGNHLIGKTSEPVAGSWTGHDCRLYALAVGAGADDPARELEFTTENTSNVRQRVLPTFGLIEGCRVGVGEALAFLPGVDMSRMLHGEQRIELYGELPVAASVKTSCVITSVLDKGTASVVETESTAVDEHSGQRYFTCRQSLYFRGYGGWGGERGPSGGTSAAPGTPDLTFAVGTRRDQALLYRLTGDNNPLHSDPAFAHRAGFPAPILHGLCVYGIIGRVLLEKLADADPARFRSMNARFSAPTTPGDELHVSVWRSDQGTQFVVDNQNGIRLLSNGSFDLA